MKEQKSFSNNKPSLYIVSTPIGNIRDITYRAVETLKSVDLILVEDTRVSSYLLKYYDINKKMLSYHEFNKELQESKIIDLLKDKRLIALISDAGTPGINDPGYEIIKAAIENDFNVISIPGPSALIASLVVSGLIIQPFTFLGFLPRKKQSFEEIILPFKYRKETIVIYESPLRVHDTLTAIYEIIGNRNIALIRELTKIHETITRTTLSEVINDEINTKGEYVIIIEGNMNDNPYNELSIKEHFNLYIRQGYSEKDSMKLVAKDRNISKSEVYKVIKT